MTEFMKYDAHHPRDKREQRYGSRLSLFCQELYYRYCVNLREEAFKEFYDSTRFIYLRYAREKCQNHRNIDPCDIVSRLYSILLDHVKGQGKRRPIKAVLSWGFGTINNLVNDDRRRVQKTWMPENLFKDGFYAKSPLDQLLMREEHDERNRLIKKILRHINGKQGLLSRRDQEVMRLYYLEGQTLKGIERQLKIKVTHAAVILYRSRKRILSYLKRKEQG